MAKSAKQQLRDDIDNVIEMLTEGRKYSDIAKHYNTSTTTVFQLLTEPEFSARAKEALKLSADIYADMAQEVLEMAEANQIEISRARELAQHFRWKAGKRNPRTYGEKIDHTTDGEKMPAPQIIIRNVDDTETE